MLISTRPVVSYRIVVANVLTGEVLDFAGSAKYVSSLKQRGLDLHLTDNIWRTNIAMFKTDRLVLLSLGFHQIM